MHLSFTALMMLIDEGLELLDEDECRRLLGSVRVGRVGVSVNGLPAIFPVNFQLVDGDIVYLTGSGVKLNAARQGTVIAFEVDDWDEDMRTGWSVLAIGAAHEVDAADESRASLEPWAQGSRIHLVRVTPELISGRRIVARPGDPI